jgi:hypothetical protein
MTVRVRMYRQGLGDCFLITFDHGGTSPKHMLIDCGSLGATTTGVRMRDVVDDIKATTGGRLELLVATHEHQDHVDGFLERQAVFTANDFEVKNVWLAWTENPKDALARQIEVFEGDLVAALSAAAAALGAAGGADVDLGLAIQDLLGFVGEPRADGLGFAPTVHDAMELVRTGLGVKPRYLRPSKKPIEPPFLPGFRFYVLGPPRSAAKLADLGEAGSSELFHAARGLAAAARFRVDGRSREDYLRELSGEARAEFERETPFDVRFCIDDRASQAVAEEHYDGSYFAPGADWRRIDRDWLHTAGDLALQLDSLTNNTSLALAIERIADERVLLFPADAQQGNWLSWHDTARTWTVKAADGSTRTVRAADLLARVVFYKAGHHASHNATAKGKGLDQMTRADELVAFIPVDRRVALGRHPKGTWRMPARALYRALLDRCQGRVVRSDLGWADDAANAAQPEVEQELTNLATAAEWAAWKQAQQAAAGRVTVGPLFVDYVLPGA